MQKKGLISKSRLKKVEKKLDAEIEKEKKEAPEKKEEPEKKDKPEKPAEPAKTAEPAKAAPAAPAKPAPAAPAKPAPAAPAQPAPTTPMPVAKPEQASSGNAKLDEINKASSSFMKKVAALNGGVDKTITNNCAMQAQSIKAINEASNNFKAAVEALDRNTAQRAINDYKEDQKAVEKAATAAPAKAAAAPAKEAAAPAKAAPEAKAETKAAPDAAPGTPPQEIITASGKKAVISNAVVKGN